MNIFVLDEDPRAAARMMCDKHIPKMVVESFQMLGSAVRRHGATDDMMPLTSKGTPLKGGYPNHPCTVWAGDSVENWWWLAMHADELCVQYEQRFGKVHACAAGITQMMDDVLPDKVGMPDLGLTDFAQAMPEGFRNADPVVAYRLYYREAKAGFAKWERGVPAPSWWEAKSTCENCGESYSGFGNNGVPLVEGRVCNGCNELVVLARIMQMRKPMPEA